MTTAAHPTFGASRGDARAVNRVIGWSLAVHVLVVGTALVVPRDWITSKRERPNLMTITLGGSAAQRTTGTTPIGGRTVEQVAPPEKRPEPARPVPPKPEPAAAPVRTSPRPDPQPSVAEIKSIPPPASRAPTTGPQVSTGNTVVDTGARGQGTGLKVDQGTTGGEVDLVNFCCPEYLEHLLGTIESNWAKNVQERGKTILKFTIHRDARITDIVVEQSSGSGILDRIARNALDDSRPRIRRLPPEYTRPTLTIHLTFPYGAQ